MFKKYILSILFVIIGSFLYPDISYSQNIELDKQEWEKLKEDYKYEVKKNKKKAPQEKKKTKIRERKPFTVGPILKWGAIIIGIGLLLFLLYKIFDLGSLRGRNIRNTQVRKQDLIMEDLTQEEFKKTEFDQLLDDAIASKNFRLAHRYSFLKSLQLMQKYHWIVWAKEKTNHDYLFATMGEKIYPNFNNLVQAFDLVWYGERGIDAQIFDVLHKEHISFNQSLKKQ